LERGKDASLPEFDRKEEMVGIQRSMQWEYEGCRNLSQRPLIFSMQMRRERMDRVRIQGEECSKK